MVDVGVQRTSVSQAEESRRRQNNDRKIRKGSQRPVISLSVGSEEKREESWIGAQLGGFTPVPKILKKRGQENSGERLMRQWTGFQVPRSTSLFCTL